MKSKRHTRSNPKNQKSSTRASKRKRRALRTPEDFFSRSGNFQDRWNLAVQVPSEMRAKGLSLRKASREIGISPQQVLNLVGSALKKGRDGRYYARPSDRLLRILPIPSSKGLLEVALNDSREASLIGEYWNGVEKFLARGDTTALKGLRRKWVKDTKGKRVRLLVNPEELLRLASAGVLHFESLYGRNA